MKANERRKQIVAELRKQVEPISASKLAQKLGVSRQIIVGDIALLRAESQDILSTPKGYVLQKVQPTGQFIGKIACQHDASATRKELELILAQGGVVLDVEVEHPVYGMLIAPLTIRTTEEMEVFLEEVAKSQASLLSELTQGIHLHTLSCPDKSVFDQIKQSLSEAHLLVDEEN